MTFKSGPMNTCVVDNLTSKPYLGGIVVVLDSYASLPGNWGIRHLRLAPRYVIQIRPSVLIHSSIL